MIIVTGATGFIGSAFIWELNQMGVSEILASDLVYPKDRPQALAKRKFADFVEARQLLKTIGDLSTAPEAIVHMGAISSTTETNEALLKEVNTDYSKTLFEYCAAKRIPFIYASSAAIYGDGDKGFSDSSPTSQFEPLNLYGKSKIAMDLWAEQQKIVPPKWYGLRFFNVYGPNEAHKQAMRSVACKAYEEIKASSRLKLFKSYDDGYKDGEQKRDFVYVKDVTRWMWELLTDAKVPNGIYNMGYGQARTWNDLGKAAFTAMGKPVQIDYIEMPENIRNQYQYFTKADMTRFLKQKVSGPQWPLEAGVQDYVKNYLARGEDYL